MNLQDVANLTIPEGEVKMIHDKNNRLLWGRLSYDTTYRGDTFQQTYTGRNLFDRANAFEDIVLIWTSGNNSTEDGSITSDYIPVNESSSYNFNYSAAVFYYDSSKTLIGHLNSNGIIVTTTGGGYFNTITVPSGYGIAYARLVFRKSTAGNPRDMTNLDIMVNTGAELLPFEPYVGGTASPNPDYPQDIDVATGEQKIGIHGKNLFDTYSTTVYAPSTTYGDVSNNNGVITTNVNGRAHIGNGFIVPVPVEPGETYCISAKMVETTSTYSIKGSVDVRTVESSGRGTRVRLLNFTSLGTFSRDFVIPDGVTEIWVSFMSYEADNYSVFSDVQIEKGSSATSFEPGTPHSYTVNLGSTELCKIGNYQDYIYKSGDDWYVHKEIQKILVDGVNIKVSTQHNTFGGINGFRINISSVGGLGYTDILSDNFNYIDWGTYQSSNREYGEISTSASVQTTIYVTQPNSTTGTTFDSAGVDSMNTWFSNHNTLIYYVLATPTDTQITDAALIGQLNAVHQFLTRYGYDFDISGNLPIIINQRGLN